MNTPIALAYGVIENFLKSEDDVEEREKLQGHLKTLQDENYRLRKYEEAAKANLADSSVNETQLKNSLTKAYRDVVSGALVGQAVASFNLSCIE